METFLCCNFGLITGQKKSWKRREKNPSLCSETVSLPPSFRACLFYCPATELPVFSTAGIFQLGKSMSCHIVHKNIGPMIIDFGDYQPRLDSAQQSRAEKKFSCPHQFILGQQFSARAPLSSALTPTVPGTAFS